MLLLIMLIFKDGYNQAIVVELLNCFTSAINFGLVIASYDCHVTTIFAK